MDFNLLISYIVVAFFYITSPGPAIFLAINNGIAGKMKNAFISALANILGLFILSSLAMGGLGTIIKTSATLFLIIKIIGALYLIYLGIKQFRLTNKVSFENFTEQNDKSLSSSFYESFLLAITNPKAIIFFTALFPQFINFKENLTEQFFILTFTFMFISFFSLVMYAYIAKSAKVVLNKGNGLRWFHRITGTLFISMGLGLLQVKAN